MPNIKNNKSKFVKNLMLVAVSTTMLSGMALEAMAMTPELTAECIKKYPNYEDLSPIAKMKAMKEVEKELGIKAKPTFVITKKAAAPLPVKAPLSTLEEIAARRADGTLLGGAKVIKPFTPEQREAKLKESLAKMEAAKEAANLLTPEQQAKIKDDRDAKELVWAIKRRAWEAEKIKEEEKARREKEAARVAETKKEAAEKDRKSLPESELVKELRAEIDLLKSTSGNPYYAHKVEGNLKENIKTLEATNSDLLIKIDLLNEQLEYLQQNNTHSNGENGIGNGDGNGNDSSEQEELIKQLKEEISSLQASAEENYRNEELLSAIEFLKQYANDGGSIDEAIELLEEYRRGGGNLTEALEVLEQKENTKIVLEQKKQEEIINTVLTETAHDMIEESTDTLAVMSAASKTSAVAALEGINNRMFEVSTLAGAVAAGDEDEPIKKGAWISGLYGVNKQGSLSNAPGYKGRSSGVTIGFDVGVNDDLIGIAYSNIQSNFKLNKSSSKAKINSHVLSLYGQKDLGQNFSLQGVISGARNYLKNKTTYSNTPVSGKYKSDSVSAEALLNYKYQTNYNLALIPNIGVRYGHVKDGVYNESNIGVQHLSVISKAQNLWTGILGGKVVFASQKISEFVSITPAIHGSVENYFNSKNKKVEAQVSWER